MKYLTKPLLLANLIIFGSVQGTTVFDKEQEVKSVLEKLSKDTLVFRDLVENAYSSRCSIDTLKKCGRNNYDECTSVYPEQVCLKPDELIISDCGDGDPCNALWSKSVSKVSIPAALAQGRDKNPTDPELIETVCYTRQVEDYMKKKYAEDERFWEKYGVTPSWTYFGAHNGVFRIYPSTQDTQCGAYDPRKRPWYIAASSGPKDVVLVIDVSGSMSDYGRLDLAIEAAETIVNTLTVADRVAVIIFSDEAWLLGGADRLVRATAEHKTILLKLISNLYTKSATNFHAAFLKAFDSLDTTIRYESTTGCNIAILFLTDGMITAGPGKDEVVALVKERTVSLSSSWGRDVYLFTYSLGQSADHHVMKEIACQTGGLWSPVDDLDYGGDLVTSMSSYYKLFALGLGEGDNEDFRAFVEPYKFFTAGKMGTTVSAPTYYRAVAPPLFLGVVAIDAYMDAIEQVLGEESASSSMLDRFVRVSTAHCPKLKLSECELEALRILGGGAEATCGACNRSDFVGIIPEQCRGVSDYPNNVWKNTDMQGVRYGYRTCCEVGESEPSDTCAASALQADQGGALSIGAIVGVTVAAVFSVCAVVYCCVATRRAIVANGSETQSDAVHPKEGGVPGSDNAEVPVAVPIRGSRRTDDDGFIIARPPSVAPSHAASAPWE